MFSCRWTAAEREEKAYEAVRGGTQALAARGLYCSPGRAEANGSHGSVALSPLSLLPVSSLE